MSAGRGVHHSEFNGSKDEPVHFLQIWIQPGQRGIAPSYEEKHFSEAERKDALRLIASPDGAEGSLHIHQDVKVRAGLLSAGKTAELVLPSGRRAWVQVARGELELNGQKLSTGDGAAITDEVRLQLQAQGTAPVEVLVFELR